MFNVLTVYRETVKPGKSSAHDAHDAHEVAWAGALVAAKNPSGFLALTAMTGSPENWYISPYVTWADYEKSNKAIEASPALTAIQKRYSSMEGEYLTDGRMMVLTSMPDLNYGGPADLAASRYFSVTRITVRPGHTAEYEESRKIIKAAHESAKLKDSFSLWRAAAGAPAGTYFQFVARKSLGEIDEGAAIHGAAYQTALGGPEGQKKLDALAASAIVSSQVDLFAFAPQQSIPPAEWLKADPGFWARKPAPIKKVQ
ncbi:MAG TPA: hypothetical protein VES67_16735 [Vicinamibacterales bacterium]|nr:hypothetical protein [Vicinamibacterales bacterium]